MKKMLLIALISLLFIASSASAEMACGVYFTKIGCPVCAKTDPVILGEWIKGEDNVVLIEYTLDSWSDTDAILMGEYNLAHGTGSSVPTMIKDIDEHYSGIPAFYTAQDILNHVDSFFEGADDACVLRDAEVSFDEINLNALPAKPKIWAGKRLLERTGSGEIDNAFLRQLLFADNLEEVLASSRYGLTEFKAEPTPYSGGSIAFAQAIDIGGEWTLELREAIELPENVAPMNPDEGNGNNGNAALAPDYTMAFSVGVIIICLIAIIVFIRGKKK